ncbi:MAG: transglycosylase domain-containing protein [Anaerolineales bacterium]
MTNFNPPPDNSGPTRRSNWADSPTIPPEGGLPNLANQARRFPENEPLPNRVEELDVNATSVTPAAMQMKTNYRPPSTRPQKAKPNRWGCLARILIVALFLLVAGLIIAAIIAVIGYYSIASTLPSVDDLRQRSSQFETTRILDRNGGPLYEILDPNAGRRTYVKLSEISPALVAATIATEDKDFYSHPGFDPAAILRAFVENYTTEGNGGGASTITQQLARALLLSPEERAERTYTRKAREIILAAEITRTYSKDDILELYLNEIYYGNLAYGIEAASETYFKTTAANLTVAQASFLAGLPQSPAVYDIYNNRQATLDRHLEVLGLMAQLSQERNCITVSNSPDPVCLTVDDALKAVDEIKNYNFPTPDVNMRYPQWVQFVRGQLEAQYDPQTIYRSGFVVYTSLDPALQDTAQQIVTDQVATLADKNASDGALVAIRPSTGEILAMVGSADFNNAAIHGQVNMATSQTRQPGSSIKPFTYTAAFEKGWTPATLIWDVPSEFPPSGDPNDTRDPYVPVNYDGRFHGPVTVRTAIANSYNIPAVKTLQFVGIYDDPTTPAKEGLISMMQRLGFTSLTRNDYGLSLTLGGGDVSLLEMTGGYAVFANGGKRIPPVAILKITDHTGNVVYEYKVPAGEQVIRAEHAYLMTSILSDTVARQPMFGLHPVIDLPFPAAAKTGTTNDFRDNWTMGYTTDLTVGVWVGNADYTPMQNTTGLTGAAPIWAAFMQAATQRLSNGNPTPFVRPPGIVDAVICSVSGTLPSKWCPDQRGEIFASDQPPLPASQDLWNKASIDTWTGLLASDACKDFVDEKMTMNVSDLFARQWLRKDDNGRAWAKSMGFDRPVFFTPDRECKADDPHATLKITNINDGDALKDERVVVNVVAWATGGFDRWHLDSAPGDSPADGDWQQLFQSGQQVKDPTDVYTWVLSKVDRGKVSLRLRMENKDGGYAERILHLKITYNPPTATPVPNATATDVPPPTNTRRPNTPVPTDTSIPPTDVPIPTNTSIPPTDVPVPTNTSIPPTDVPAPTDTPAPAP